MFAVHKCRLLMYKRVNYSHCRPMQLINHYHRVLFLIALAGLCSVYHSDIAKIEKAEINITNLYY
jgi:hypothetical protein